MAALDTSSAETARRDSVSLMIRAACVAFLLLTLGLVAAFRFPPVLDFANHYARAWLIAGGLAEEPFRQIYTLDWSRTSTNIGMDAAALALGPVIGVDLLMRGLLWLAIILAPLGAMALHRQLFGSGSPWMLTALFFAWSAPMIGGFLNFQIGLGIALFAAALDNRLCNSSALLLFATRFLVSLLLVYDHIFALGFYMLLLGGLAIGPDWRALSSWAAISVVIRRVLAQTLACIGPPALVLLTAKSLPGAHVGVGESFRHLQFTLDPMLMLANLLSAFWTYALLVDTLLFLPVALIAVRALRRKDLRLHAGLVIVFLLLIVMSCLSPVHAFGTGWISWRFPIMAALVSVAMMQPFGSPQARSFAPMLLIVLTAVGLGRTAWIGANWWRSEADMRETVAVIEKIPAGAAVLPVIHSEDARGTRLALAHRNYAWNENTYRHFVTLAVPLAHAFVPTLFAAEGKQPLNIRAEWRDRAVPETSLLSIQALECRELRQQQSFTDYMNDWRAKFDYVLVLNADVPDAYAGDRTVPGLLPVAGDGFARLYRIDKTFGASDGPFDCAVKAPER